MTPRMHLSPAARTACAALLTSLLVAAPAVAPAAGHSPGESRESTHAEQVRQPDIAPVSLGGGSDPQLAASQEGAWMLGRSVDSVLGPGQWYTAEQGRTWYGAYRTFPDEFAYCVDAGLKTPHPRHFDGEEEGEAITSARSAWALGAHAQSESAHVHAALSALVRLDEDIPHRHQIPPGHPSDLGADFADVAEEFAAIEEDAELFAGPYTLSVDIRVRTLRALDWQDGPPLQGAQQDAAQGADKDVDQPSSDDGGLLASGFPLEAVVSLTSASGEPMTGHRVNLSATGARTAVDSVVTAEQPTVVALTDLDADRFTVDASAADLPATTVELHRPRGLGSDRVQAVVTAGEPTKATAQAVYDRPTQPEEADPPRVEVPNPQPTTLPTSTPEPTEEPSEEPSGEPSEGPSEKPEETPTTAPPAPPETPEPPPTPDVPETPEAPETSESPESPKASEAPEAPESSKSPETPEVTEAPTETTAPEPPNEAPRDTEDEALPASLPRTGADSLMALGLAITLIAVGVAALTFTRRG